VSVPVYFAHESPETLSLLTSLREKTGAGSASGSANTQSGSGKGKGSASLSSSVWGMLTSDSYKLVVPSQKAHPIAPVKVQNLKVQCSVLSVCCFG